jgi:hypothetical protein
MVKQFHCKGSFLMLWYCFVFDLRRQILAEHYALTLTLWFFTSAIAGAQIPRLESGEECFDWFLLSWENVEKKHAVVGHVEATTSPAEGTVSIDWFEIKCSDASSKSALHYCETRFSFSETMDNGLKAGWTKSLYGLKKPRWSSGDLSTPMNEFDAPFFDLKGKLISGVPKTHFPPNAFTLAVLTGGAFQMCREFDYDYVVNTVSGMRKFEQPDELNGNTSVFMCDNLRSKEVISDRDTGMPRITRGYFRDPAKRGQPDRSFFPTLNFEAKTTWECLDEREGVFAPKAIDNFVHRDSPQSKSTTHVQLAVAYAIENVSSDLLSDANLELYLSKKGPTAELRETLFEKVQTRRLELSK